MLNDRPRNGENQKILSLFIDLLRTGQFKQAYIAGQGGLKITTVDYETDQPDIFLVSVSYKPNK